MFYLYSAFSRRTLYIKLTNNSNNADVQSGINKVNKLSDEDHITNKTIANISKLSVKIC